MTVLTVDLNGKTYPSRTPGRDYTALGRIAFSVPEGQFTCILGPSGCGKTTLLNIISGLDPNFDGTVRFGEVSPDHYAIGYVFQAPRLLDWLTVLDNVRIVMDKGSIREGYAERLLEEMHLGDVMGAYPNRLSGGMQRRVALARAFAVKPRLLLMDEPFVYLDAPVADRLRGLLLETWRARPTTVLFVTHDLREAIYLADRVLFMSSSPGRIVLDLPVKLPRPRAGDTRAVDELAQSLLREHPELLAGLTKGSDDEEAASGAVPEGPEPGAR